MRFQSIFKPVRIIRRFTIKQWLLTGILLSVLVVVSVLGIRVYSALQASGDIYALDKVPDEPVAIIFGAQVYENDVPSPMLADRVKAGADLYKAGKVKVLLMTGDNHITTYNEPEAMREYAESLGVPYDAIVLDYAGFRTYDSCYRARDIFKVSKAVLVTQGFHLDRALLTCNDLGIQSVGVAADVERAEGYTPDTLFYSTVREFPSTVLTVFDLLRGKKPYYLGEPLPIMAAVR